MHRLYAAIAASGCIKTTALRSKAAWRERNGFAELRNSSSCHAVDVSNAQDWLNEGSMKHIGIVAVSAEGAALCYRTICLEGAAMLGPHAHPEVSLHCFPLATYQTLIDRPSWEAVGEKLLESATRLVPAGAQVLICPDNTVHQGLDLVRHRSLVPWLHIAEEVVVEAQRHRFRRVAILGTRFLMEGPVYPDKLRAAGMDYRIPAAYQRERINRIIYEELVYGRLRAESMTYFQNVIGELATQGCDAVALACTEIPLLIDQEGSVLPVLDSTRILARAALQYAIG
jgi:aspartate racemase